MNFSQIRISVLIAFALFSLNVFQAKAKEPRPVRLMIAGFGTIESMTKVDAWLSEQLQENRTSAKSPTLTASEKIADPENTKRVAYVNWLDRRTVYLYEESKREKHNLENRELLRALRTKVLSDASMRYVPIAKDYLQASLQEKAEGLIQVVDRGNVDMGMVEQSIAGNDASELAGATCILTAAFGDREVDSKTVAVNGKGTKVRLTTYTQPYVGKVRDVSGNVLLSFRGTAEWTSKQNSVVKQEFSDPARKLTEKACEQIAERLTGFFTTNLEFRIKVPKGMDEGDVSISLNGEEVDDPSEPLQILAVEQTLRAELDGCEPIQKKISFSGMPKKSKKVTLKFKKIAEAKDDD